MIFLVCCMGFHLLLLSPSAVNIRNQGFFDNDYMIILSTCITFGFHIYFNHLIHLTFIFHS